MTENLEAMSDQSLRNLHYGATIRVKGCNGRGDDAGAMRAADLVVRTADEIYRRECIANREQNRVIDAAIAQKREALRKPLP